MPIPRNAELVDATSNGNEIVVTEPYLDVAQRRIEHMARVVKLAIRSTNPRDWLNQNGHPYLCGTGAEKIGRNFGLKITDVTYTKQEAEDEEGKYYMYIVKGRASLPSTMQMSGSEPLADSIVAIGTCSSRDKFFSMAHGKMLPMSEIDEGNILKSAYTNMLGNGITRLLGLRNLTWEELREHGIEKDAVQSVEYGRKGGNGDDSATGKQIKLIKERVLKSHVISDEEKTQIQQQLDDGMTKSEASRIIDVWMQRHDKDKKKNNKPDDTSPPDDEPAPEDDDVGSATPAKQYDKQCTDDFEKKRDKKSNGEKGERLATEEQVNALAQIVEDTHTQPFEKYMLNLRIADDKLSFAIAKVMIQHWNDEIGKRIALKTQDAKEYYKYLGDQLAQAINHYPDEYGEFMQQ